MRARPLPAVALVAALLVAGCFDPKLEPGFRCGADPPGPQCPAGFSCDQATNTCLREGTAPTPAGVSLGNAYPGLVAARLGTGLVVAGWFEGAGQQPEFQVRRFDQDGEELENISRQAAFDPVDPSSLRAAGAANVAVIVGQVPSGSDAPDRLVRLWVHGGPPSTIEEADEGEATAAAATSSASRACFVRAFPGTAGIRGADLACHDGTTESATWTVHEATLRELKWVTASVTDDPSDDAVFAETNFGADVNGFTNELLAFCPGQNTAHSFGRFKPQDVLGRPHAARSPSGSPVYVGWVTEQGIETFTTDSTCTKTPLATFAGTVAAFTVSAGSTSGPAGGVRGMSLRGDPQVGPMAESWSFSPGSDYAIVMDPAHAFYANPHAVTDSVHDFWFLFFASNDNEQQGWVKCAAASLPTQSVTAVGSDNGTFAADFVAVRRSAGGFFLVARDNPNNIDFNQALETFLAPIRQDLTVVTPPTR